MKTNKDVIIYLCYTYFQKYNRVFKNKSMMWVVQNTMTEPATRSLVSTELVLLCLHRTSWEHWAADRLFVSGLEVITANKKQQTQNKKHTEGREQASIVQAEASKRSKGN
jgi:hypothetical protein